MAAEKGPLRQIARHLGAHPTTVSSVTGRT